MKKKKRKDRSDPHGWRKYSICLPPDFVKGLADARDETGNPVSLPIRRGNAIINRLAQSLKLARNLSSVASKYELTVGQMQDRLSIYEKIMKENEIDYQEEIKRLVADQEQGAEQDGVESKDSSGSDGGEGSTGA